MSRGYYGKPQTAAAYDAQIATARDVVVDDIPYYTALARDSAAHGAGVLELGCGTGRVTLPMAATGAEVVGLDNAPAMLEVARGKATAAGITSVGWVEADMTDFDLDRRFGLVVVPFRSLQLLLLEAELAGCFAAVRRHLEPGGLLAFNLASPLLPGGLASGGVEGAPLIARPEPGLAMRYYRASEIEALLAAAGLKTVSLAGWFDGRAFDETSTEMVWLAEML